MKRNYCEIKYMPRFVDSWLSKKFNAPCKQHFIHYKKGRLTKHEADELLYRSMMTRSKSPLDRLLAKMYCTGIRRWAEYAPTRKKRK